MSKFMYSCAEAAKLSSQAMDAPLTPWERLLLRAHLAMCERCTNFTGQMHFLRRAARKLPEALEKDGA